VGVVEGLGVASPLQRQLAVALQAVARSCGVKQPDVDAVGRRFGSV